MKWSSLKKVVNYYAAFEQRQFCITKDVLVESRVMDSFLRGAPNHTIGRGEYFRLSVRQGRRLTSSETRVILHAWYKMLDSDA